MQPTRSRAKKPQGMTKKVSRGCGDGGDSDVVEERREEEKIGPSNGEGEEDVIVVSGAKSDGIGIQDSPAAFTQTVESTPGVPDTQTGKKYDGGAWDEADVAQVIDEARSFRTTAIPIPSSTDSQPTEETTLQISNRRSMITKYSISALPPLAEEPRALPHSREATGNMDVDLDVAQPVEGMEYMDAKSLEKEIEESSSSDEDEEMVEQHTHVTAPQAASFGDELITIGRCLQTNPVQSLTLLCRLQPKLIEHSNFPTSHISMKSPKGLSNPTPPSSPSQQMRLP
jgi:hypothetical protein